jgi:Tol biopolymer transport system component
MASQTTTDDRLDGWEAIAHYLGWTPRTVIRWEKQKGLPVHRVAGGKRQPVYAYRHEIDLWFQKIGASGLVDVSTPADPRSEPDAVLHAEPIIGARTAGLGSRWLTGKEAVALVVVCVVFFAAFALRQTSSELTVGNPTRMTRSQTRILSPLLTDGAQIFYPRYENGMYSVAAVSAKGGESTTVATSIANPELCDITPDGKTMLLRNLIHSRDDEEPMYIQSIGGQAQRVGDILAYDAAWTPHAKRIIYSADGIVYSTDLKGKSKRQLFSVPGNAFWFRWAPDGKRLRFTVIDKKTEDTSIWEVTMDGRAPHRLFSKLQHLLCCGSWTPDGKYFLFQVRVESMFQIWAQRDRYLELLPIRNRPFPLVSGAVSYRGPLPSKDGRKLIVRAEAPKGELVRYDFKLGEFISILPSISARTLAYSKDKNWIAYTSLADNNLWRCRADGTNWLQLTQNFKDTIMPRWSPDGKTIAFMGLGFTGDWGIFSVPASGGTIRSLSHESRAKGYPDWSLDGQRLAFSDVPPVSRPKGIYILDLRSHKAATLPQSTGYFSPRWSPDGRFLVALHAGDQYLYLFDSDSGKWRPLAQVPACYPNWSHDGKYVYFRPATADSRAIFRVAVATRNVEKVASLAGVERGPFFLGDWIGLAPDDSPITVRNSTIEDIYAWDLNTK